MLIVLPNVTWTSAIRVFLTHLNTETDTQANSERSKDEKKKYLFAPNPLALISKGYPPVVC